ncbi:hypothetical protein [Rhodoferax sp. GW822-FHT02A01]|uniref:hypothetical protein n=1 Tax=Rhodoferax sp. GW822-FHT02A01 TaxID=3141537 RepID=UPI00315C6F71
MPQRPIWNDTLTAIAVGVARQAPDLGVIITVTAKLTCTSGNCSATARLEGSNNGTDWYAVGADQVFSSGASPQTAAFTRVQFAFAQYRINCTAISGTGAALVTDIAVGS